MMVWYMYIDRIAYRLRLSERVSSDVMNEKDDDKMKKPIELNNDG